MSRLSRSDVKRFGLEGDPGFDASHNEAVIKQTIEKTQKVYAQKQRDIDAGLQERSELVYDYIRHSLNKNSDMEITEYAGWETMKRLWGESRVSDLQDRARKLGYKV